MKITAILLTVCSLTVAAKSVSQSITFSGKDVGLKTIFSAVKQQTGFYVIYNEALLEKASPVTIAATNMPLKEFMDKILEGQPLNYSLDNTTITIRRKNIAKRKFPVNPSLFQELPPITVRGRVVNEKGEPVAASVVIKGTNRGVTTDSYGNFELSDVDGNAVLVVSGINIETQEMKISGKSEISINAITKVTAEEEVVYNGGYYKTTDKKRTGNIVKVSAKEIERQPVTSPLLAVQGRVTGVDIVAINGFPGTAPRIQIRGQNSLRPNGNYALYVIDGVPIDSRPLATGSDVADLLSSGFDPFSTINPANIQSIEILKDADATAIYGSRGANGVILVTTKSGNKTGTTNVQFDIYKGFGKIVNKAKLMNRVQYLEMRNEAYLNAGITPPSNTRDLFIWDTTRETDWQDALLGGTAQVTNAQVNILWSAGNTSFRLGGGFAEQGTIYPGDFGFQNITGNFSLNHQSSNKKFNLLLSANYGANKNKLLNNQSVINNAYTLAPVAPRLYDDNGDLNWELGPNGIRTWTNPLSYLLKRGEQKQNNITVTTNLSYSILPGIDLKLNMGFTDLGGNEYYINPIASVGPESRPYALGSAVFTNISRQTWNIEPQLVFTRSVKKHHLNAIVGGAFQQSTSIYQAVDAGEYSSDALLGSLKGAKTTIYRADNNLLYKYLSALARVGYDYEGKYLLNISGRRDGSSRFGPGKQFGNFGAIGAAWIFSEEEFIKRHLSFLSFGKIRGSYGVTGNDQIPDYAYFDTYSPTTLYHGAVGIEPTALSVPDFAWEETKKLEVGLQMGLFADKLVAEISWYKNRTSNNLVSYALPVTTGFTELTAFNFPALVQNIGWEYQLKLDILKKKNITWTTSFNFSQQPKNKLVAFDGIENSSYALQYKIGEPLSIKRVFIFTGVDSISGLYTVKDINNDGVISDADKQLKNVGRRQSYGGVNNMIRFKNLELSFLFRFVKQDMYVSRQGGAGLSFSNQFADYPSQRWTTEKKQAIFQKYSAGFDAQIAYANYANSDGIYSDASFWRLQNLSLTYYIPVFIQKKLKLNDAKVFIHGENLLTITSFKTAFDPETNTSLPPLKMLNFGASFKF